MSDCDSTNNSRTLEDVNEEMARTLAKSGEVKQRVHIAMVDFKDVLDNIAGKLAHLDDELKSFLTLNEKQKQELLQKLNALEAERVAKIGEVNARREAVMREGLDRAAEAVEGCDDAQTLVNQTFTQQKVSVEDALLIVGGLLENQKQAVQQGQLKVPDDSVVSLNVGGQIFMTTRKVLEGAGEGTYFFRLLRGQEVVPRGQDGSFFIDRDPKVFQHVLNFLRNEMYELQHLSDLQRGLLSRDATFYEVDGLSLYLSGKTRLHFVRGGKGGKGKEFEVETANLKQQFPQPPTQHQPQLQPPLGDTFFVRMLDGRVAVKRNARHAFVIDRDADLFEKFVLPIIINGPSHQHLLPLKSSLSASEVSALEDEEKFYGMIMVNRIPPKPLLNKIKSGPNYSLDATGTIATKTGSNGWDANCLGSAPIPAYGKWKWRITLKCSKFGEFMIGVAPASLDQSGTNMYMNCGWYFRGYNGTLYSGPPTSHSNKKYATGVSEMKAGEYVDVIVDRDARTISFAVNGVDKGVAYKDVFAAKDDIRPCVLMRDQNDSFQIGSMDSC